jgi:uncharacterized membrane protein YdbT with pleckstrin-like domain
MSYIETVLEPDESVLEWAHLHWIIFVPAFGLLLVGAVMLAVAIIDPNLSFHASPVGAFGIALMVVAFFMRIWAGATRKATEIAVTTDRVIIKRGVFRLSTIEMNADQIESVQVEQSILGRLFDFGTVTINGTGSGIEPIPKVAAPVAFRKAVGVLSHRSRWDT